MHGLLQLETISLELYFQSSALRTYNLKRQHPTEKPVVRFITSKTARKIFNK